MSGSTLDGVPRILGIPISDDDARHLIATLLAEGTPDALTAAAQLTKGVERGLYAVGLGQVALGGVASSYNTSGVTLGCGHDTGLS